LKTFALEGVRSLKGDFQKALILLAVTEFCSFPSTRFYMALVILVSFTSILQVHEERTMSEQVENLAFELLDADQNIGGVCVIDSSGNIIFQTENWDLTNDAASIMKLDESASSISLLGIRYMIVENVPERIIGTNVTGKGHLVICPAEDKGKIVCYIVPQAGPRDALFNVMTYGGKIAAVL